MIAVRLREAEVQFFELNEACFLFATGFNKSLKKILRTFTFFLAMIVLTLAFAEGMARWKLSHAFIQNPGEDGNGTIKQAAMREFVQDKINSLCTVLLSLKQDFYIPPFEVFVNNGFDDEQRIKFIASRSKLPLSQSVQTHNFLRRIEDESAAYTVTSNSLGFRGVERSVQKPPNTFRIMVLGAYPAFGHGVNDDETYSAYLEKALNKDFKKNKMHFEVWNGGRQGSSSIMGYARLKEEFDPYKPDLIIWDYGWVEPFLSFDISSAEKNGERPLRLVNNTWLEKQAVDFCWYRRNRLKICQLIVNKFTKFSTEDVEQGWLTAMNHAKQWVLERHLPMIYIKYPGVAIDDRVFERSEEKQNKIFYMNMKNCIFDNKLSEKEVAEFWSKRNWLNEMNYTEKTLPDSEKLNLYFGDAIMYNAMAFKREAGCLKDKIKKDILARSSVKTIIEHLGP